MSNPLAEDALRKRGLVALENELGPVETLRFLALLSRQPLDYQHWREQHFAGMSLADIFAQCPSAPEHTR
jgi:hypothetical protein